MRSALKFMLLVWISLAACRTGRAEAVDAGAVDDPNLRYIGRWDANTSGTRHGYWSGVYLRTVFTGTSASIKLAGPTLLAVSIDGEPAREVSAAAGITRLNADPLKPRDHSLQVGSAGQNYEVNFQGLLLDAGAITKPAQACPLIEYIGDSITQGNVSYAWLSAEMLGCDHVQIAFSGVALTSGFGCSTKVGMDTQYFCLKNFNHASDMPQVPWSFSYTPDAVVINLGQNDQCGKEPDATFQQSYEHFVRAIREKFPRVSIFALRTFGGPYEKPARAAVDSIVRNGDSRLHYVDTAGWLQKDDFRDGIHPNVVGSLKAGRRLANVLDPLINPQSSTAPSN
jgi:lysophospholipase L1-like esterase